MERLTAKDFAPELLELYDYYAHGKINRREFLDRAAVFTLGGLTASALLASLSPNYALAEQVEFTDPDIIAEYVKLPLAQRPWSGARLSGASRQGDRQGCRHCRGA